MAIYRLAYMIVENHNTVYHKTPVSRSYYQILANSLHIQDDCDSQLI